MKIKFLPKFTFLIFFCVCASLFFSPVYSQSISTGKVVGKVFLNSGELVPGVDVEISGSALLEGKRTTVSSDNGSFYFLDVPIGKYKITASMEGFKTATYRDVAIAPGGVVTLNLILEPGSISEAVEVRGSVPTVDVKTSTVDSKITREMLAKMPTSRDSFYDLSLSTPGMFDVGKNVMGSPTAYGGSTNENIFLINGVDTTNPSGSAYGSMINVNYNTVEEVRVISLGSKAEYGNFSGVAIDVITKSGSNELQGSLGLYSQLGKPTTGGVPKNLGRDWLYLEPGANYDAYPKSDLELDLTVGGPFISKKLWFFAAGNILSSQNKELNWDPIAKNTNRYADLKVTGTPFKNHHAWIAYHYENNNSSGTTDGSINWDPSMAYNSYDKSHTVSAQWQWFPSTATFFSLKFLGFWVNTRSALPSDAPDHPGYVNWYQAVPFDLGAGGAFEGVTKALTSRTTIQADVSHYAENFLGEHDIKFGVQYTRGRLKGIYGDFFGEELIDPYTNQDLGFFGIYNSAYLYAWNYDINYLKDYYGWTDGLIMYANRSYSRPALTERITNSTGFFFDDQWTLGKKLTFNLGLRYDMMTAKFGSGGQMMEQPATPADWANDLTSLRSRAGSGNLFDFKNWSPRLGVTYQLTNDQKTALRASFGRYYTPMGVESFGSGGPDLDRTYTKVFFYEIPWEGVDENGDGVIFGDEMQHLTQMLPYLTPYETQFWENDPSWGLKIQPGLKNQHTDQYTFSIEREIFRDFSLAATFIHRDTKDMIVQWPLNKQTQQEWEYERKTQTINGQQIELYSIVLKDYNQDGVIDGQDIHWIGQNSDFEWRNMQSIDGKKAQRVFQGLQLTFTKRYSDRWQMMGSLLFNHSSGFAARNKRQDQDYNMEGTNIWSDAWVAGINQTVNNMDGPLPFTPRFEFKLAANYTIPKIEVDVGFRFRLHTGRPAWVLAEVQQINEWNYDPDNTDLMEHGVILNGGGGMPGQIVAQDPTKPLYLPVQKLLDVHLEKTFHLGRGNLHVLLDGFNIFNAHDVTNAMVKRVEIAGILARDIGRVVGLTTPRTFRLGLLYEF
jgi:outer membrane receptor protein involved in Fe transport